MDIFRRLHQPTNRIISLEQEDYLFFGGTAYLGLLVNEDYRRLVVEGLYKYGINNGTSRSNNVQLGIYDEAEELLAKRFGFAQSALFSSGYLAAQAAVRQLSLSREVFYAPHTHPALWIDGRPQALKEDVTEWTEAVVDAVNASPSEYILLIANAIDNLKPERYDFNVLKHIREDKKVLLLLDDSHGLGVVRKNALSAGVQELKGCHHIEVAVVASLAKGLGTDAGIVLASTEVVDEVKRSPIFMGASPSSPAFIYALAKGESIYEQAFDRLHNNIAYVCEDVAALEGLSYAEDFPVFTSTDSQLYAKLLQHRILVSSFPYPLPTSEPLNRIVISALHEPQDLQRLTEVLHSVLE